MLSCGIRAIAPVVNAHTVIKTLHDVVEIGDIARILKAQNLPTAIHDNFAGAADVEACEPIAAQISSWKYQLIPAKLHRVEACPCRSNRFLQPGAQYRSHWSKFGSHGLLFLGGVG